MAEISKEKYHVFEVSPAPKGVIQEVIQKRLNYAHDVGRVPHNSLISVDESGIDEISRRCEGVTGFALYLLYSALPSSVELLTESGNQGFIISAERIANQGKTFNDFERWDGFERNIAVIDLGAHRMRQSSYSQEERAVLDRADKILDVFKEIIRT